MPSDVGVQSKVWQTQNEPLAGAGAHRVSCIAMCIVCSCWRGFHGSGCWKESRDLQHSCRFIAKGRMQSKAKLRLQGCSPPSLDLPLSFLLFPAPPKCSSHPPLLGINSGDSHLP